MYSLVDEVASMYRKQSLQNEKEAYIANMLINTLYSNDVSNAECYRIIKLFKDMVLGSHVTIKKKKKRKKGLS